MAVVTHAMHGRMLPVNEEILDDLVTTAEVREVFKRSEQTLASWRKYKGLPYVRIPSDRQKRAWFRMSAVIEWAEENNIEIVNRPKTSRKRKKRPRIRREGK